jgi:hypothetical protein
VREKITEKFVLSACLLCPPWVGLLSSSEDEYLVLIDSALVNLSVLVLIGAILMLPLSLIVGVLMASLVKPTWSFIVLVLLDAALVNLTWSFSVHALSWC